MRGVLELLGNYGWSGGVLAADGNIYGIPFHATKVLHIGTPAGLFTKVEAEAVLKAVEAKGAELSWKTHHVTILLLRNNEFGRMVKQRVLAEEYPRHL